MILRMLAFCAAMSLLAGAAIAGDAPTKPPTRPEWCRAGYSCIETKELAADALYKIDLQERLALAEAKIKARRLFGVHVTCGIGVAAVATVEFDAKLAPAGFCGVGWGW